MLMPDDLLEERLEPIRRERRQQVLNLHGRPLQRDDEVAQIRREAIFIDEERFRLHLIDDFLTMNIGDIVRRVLRDLTEIEHGIFPKLGTFGIGLSVCLSDRVKDVIEPLELCLLE